MAELPASQPGHARKRVLGDEHPDTLTNKGNLASTYRNKASGRKLKN